MDLAPRSAGGSVAQALLDEAGTGLSVAGRSVSAEETWDRVRAMSERMGVTRLGDVTGLDRLGIPVWQAVAPRSNDLISVYSGKGLTSVAAKVSALMECFERYCASLAPPVAVEASYSELMSTGTRAVRPGSMSTALHPRYDDHVSIPWTWGYDLVSGAPTLVSVSQATHRLRRFGPPVNLVSGTTGLAGGNTISEAVLHGLLEVIENDAWTLADLLGQQLPHLLHKHGVRVANPAINPIRLTSLAGAGADLLASFARSEMEVTLLSIGSDVQVPVVMAFLRDREGAFGLSSIHHGFGADPDPAVAVVRALTEVAQSRACDISGTREDLSAADEVVPAWMKHTQRRVDTATVPFLGLGAPIDIGSLPGYQAASATTLIEQTVDRLRRVGLEQVVVVDLSVPDVPLHVTRTLIPGAETWSSDRSKLGERAVAAWNAVLRRLTADEGTQ